MDSGAANQKSFLEGRVGFDGVDTVIRVQGIVLLGRAVSERDVLLGRTSRVAPRRITPRPYGQGVFLIVISGRLYVLPNIRRG